MVSCEDSTCTLIYAKLFKFKSTTPFFIYVLTISLMHYQIFMNQRWSNGISPRIWILSEWRMIRTSGFHHSTQPENSYNEYLMRLNFRIFIFSNGNVNDSIAIYLTLSMNIKLLTYIFLGKYAVFKILSVSVHKTIITFL